MAKVIIYTIQPGMFAPTARGDLPPEGGVAVVRPSGEIPIGDVLRKDVPQGVPYRIVDETELPQSRTFRNAWTMGQATVDVDMPKARNIHRDRLRALREPLLKALDTDYQRADEAGDAKAKAAIAKKKQALRDVTSDPAIEAATTPEQLAAVMPAALL